MSTRTSKLQLSEPTKNALVGVLGLRIMELTIGSDEAAESYSQMQEAGDIAASLAKYETEASSVSVRDLATAMLSLYGNQSPDVVIDAGSGPGISSELLRQQLKPRTLILVDMIPEALELAKRRFADPSRFNDTCDILYLEDRIENLQKNQNIPQADLVFMRLVMRYIPLRDYQAFFASAHHVLKPDGTVIFDIPL